MAALEARPPPMGTRSADPLNAAVRRENVDSTWGEPGIDGANNKVSSYILTPDRATLYITPFSYSKLEMPSAYWLKNVNKTRMDKCKTRME